MAECVLKYEIRVGLRIHVILPEWRNMVARQYGVLIAVIDAIVKIALDIFAVYNLLISFHNHCFIFIK